MANGNGAYQKGRIFLNNEKFLLGLLRVKNIKGKRKRAHPH
jgi:hypothetical protein